VPGQYRLPDSCDGGLSMSQFAKDPQEMTDEELLETVASYDEDEYPVAKHAKRALNQGEEDSS